MWVHISQVLKRRSFDFKQGIQNTQTLEFLKRTIQHLYPSLYPYIQNQYIQDDIITIRVKEPVILSEFNAQKQTIKVALKRNNIIVRDIKFII